MAPVVKFRLKVVANQILNDIPQAKRDGHGVG